MRAPAIILKRTNGFIAWAESDGAGCDKSGGVGALARAVTGRNFAALNDTMLDKQSLRMV